MKLTFAHFAMGGSSDTLFHEKSWDADPVCVTVWGFLERYDGNIVFYSSLQIPKDGKTKKAGYCNMKSMRPRVSSLKVKYCIQYSTVLVS